MELLTEYISKITPETDAEDIKQYLLKYNQNRAEQNKSKEQENELNNKIIVKNVVKLSNIYKYYKTNLITKNQREKVKKHLIDSGYIIPKLNKADKIVSYNINEEKINDFNDWIKLNLTLN